MQGTRERIVGLKKMEQSGAAFDQDELALLSSRLFEKMPRLKIQKLPSRKKGSTRIGDTVRFRVEGLPLPDIDLYEGRLATADKASNGMPILAVFEGMDGPVSSICRFNRRSRTLTAKVPDRAVSGMVMLQLPVREATGPLKKRTRAELARESAFCSPREEISIDEQRFRYMPYVACFLDVMCQHCMMDPICPYGAIQFDAEGYCFVDEGVCRGMSREIVGQEIVNGRSLRVMGNEVSCWECFSGDESLSGKCQHRKVSKVLKIGNDYGC